MLHRTIFPIHWNRLAADLTVNMGGNAAVLLRSAHWEPKLMPVHSTKAFSRGSNDGNKDLATPYLAALNDSAYYSITVPTGVPSIAVRTFSG